MVTVTSLHFSPKVLMISAVCGRAPPCVSPPKPLLVPPEWPEISHDLLSVTKTRAFSCANKDVAKRHTAMKTNFLCKGSSLHVGTREKAIMVDVPRESTEFARC